MVRRICILLAAVLLTPVTALAGELYKADTRQLYCFSDMLRAYIDIEDRNSEPAAKPGRENVEGYIDGVKLITKSVSRFGDTNEGVADIFLIDVSGSMRDSQMAQVKAAIKTWASNMKPNDKIAVVAFGDNVKTLTDFSSDKNAVSSAVDSITNNDKNTQLYGGISHALKLASRDDKDLPKRKNIVLITDGVNDYAGGISEEDVYAQLKSSLVPVYSMWMSDSRENDNAGRATLNSVTEYSGGRIYDMSNKSIDTVYGWIKQSILNSYTIDFAYSGAEPDNGEHSFSVRTAENNKTAEDSVRFTMRITGENSGTSQIEAVDDEKNSEKEDKKDTEKDKDKDKDKEEKDGEDTEEEDKKLNKTLIFILVGAIILLAAAAVILILVMRRRDNDPIETTENDGGFFESSTYGNNYTGNISHTNGGDKTIGVNFVGSVSRNNPDRAIKLCSPTQGVISAVLRDRVTVGRSSQNDIVINSPMISGNHAVFAFEEGRLYIADLGSLNGTLVNGRMINAKTEVRNGDMIMFGNEEYKINF